MGYSRAGFTVVGVDIDPQPNYPFDFMQGDAVEFLRKRGYEFDAIHASPPCQRYTNCQKIQQREHPDLIDPIRAAMPSGVPWIIENVPRSPLRNPVTLCGHSFGLGTYRHRLFEASFPLTVPGHREHDKPTTKMGRPPKPGEMMHVVGNFSGVKAARAAMGIDWMSRDELREAIPPVYTEFLGRQLREAMKLRRSA